LIAQNNKEKVEFYNRLHLDHMVENDELVSAEAWQNRCNFKNKVIGVLAYIT
ncbi:26875_t:CDS:2, partial [Gigaspora margarita]